MKLIVLRVLAITLTTLAAVNISQAADSKALKEARKIWKKEKDLGDKALKANDYLKAYEHYELAVEQLVEFPENDYRRATTLMEMGSIQSNLRKFHDAVTSYEGALECWKKYRHDKDPAIAQIQTRLASAYLRVGSYELAEQATLAARKMMEIEHGKFSWPMAYSYNTEGRIHSAQQKWDKAEECFRKAVEVAEKPNAPLLLHDDGTFSQVRATDDFDLGFMYEDLANCLTRQNKFQEAENLYQRAIKHYVKRQDKDTLDKVTPLHGLAMLYLKSKQPEKAEAALKEAYALCKKHKTRHPQVVQILTSLKAFASQRNDTAAVAEYDAALAAQKRP